MTVLVVLVKVFRFWHGHLNATALVIEPSLSNPNDSSSQAGPGRGRRPPRVEGKYGRRTPRKTTSLCASAETPMNLRENPVKNP